MSSALVGALAFSMAAVAAWRRDLLCVVVIVCRYGVAALAQPVLADYSREVGADAELYLSLAKNGATLTLGDANANTAAFYRLADAAGLAATDVGILVSVVAGIVTVWALRRLIGPGLPRPIVLLLALMPTSIVFQSLVGREGLVMVGVLLTAPAGVRVAQGAAIGARYGAIALAGTAVLVLVRPYMAGCVAVGAIAAAVTGRSLLERVRSPRRSGSRIALVGLLGVVVAGLLVELSRLQADGSILQEVGELSLANNRGGSALNLPPVDGIADVPMRLAVGLPSILFRPTPADITSAFQALAAVEVLSVILASVYLARRLDPRSAGLRWAACVLVCVALVQAVGINNLGTVVRLRSAVAPLWVAGLAGLWAIRPRLRGVTSRAESSKGSSVDQATGPRSVPRELRA